MRKLPPPILVSIKIASTICVGIYMYTFIAGVLPPLAQRGILVGVCMVLIFLLYPLARRARRLSLAIDILFIIVTVYAIGLIIYTGQQFIQLGYYELRPAHVPIAIAFTFLVLEASRRVMGPVISIIALIFLIYGFTGSYWPGIFHSFRLSPMIVIEAVAISSEGIFGMIAHIVSTIIVAFLIFASFLKLSGASKFFIDLPMALFGRVRGGPAKVAVVSSGLFGMFSGSAVANVLITGTFTIPLMKNTGYEPAEAGAIEACASTGGQLTPPIMGAAAFIMADFLGISYWSVCMAAAIPAILYYVALFSTVDIKAVKLGMGGLSGSQLPSVRATLKSYGFLVIPLAILVYLLAVIETSPMFACFWAIISVFALSWLRRESWMTPKRIIDSCEDAIKSLLPVVMVCSVAGVIISILGLTALGHKLSLALFEISHGNIFVLLILASIVCYILGMGVTTTAIYIMVGTLVAPALIKAGIVPIAAHLAVFYFGMLCTITPPVAPAVFAAVSICKESLWKIGRHSIRLGLVLFILPFVFVFEPSLVLKGDVFTILLTLVSTLASIILITFTVEGASYWGRMGAITRVIFAVAAVLLAIPGLQTDLFGSVALAIGGFWHWQEKGQRKE